jgi:hypothetical protein
MHVFTPISACMGHSFPKSILRICPDSHERAHSRRLRDASRAPADPDAPAVVELHQRTTQLRTHLMYTPLLCTRCPHSRAPAPGDELPISHETSIDCKNLRA